jgi:hypothetical protein
MANAAVLKTAVRKDLGVRIPRPPLSCAACDQASARMTLFPRPIGELRWLDRRAGCDRPPRGSRLPRGVGPGFRRNALRRGRRGHGNTSASLAGRPAGHGDSVVGARQRRYAQQQRRSADVLASVLALRAAVRRRFDTSEAEAEAGRAVRGSVLTAIAVGTKP